MSTNGLDQKSCIPYGHIAGETKVFRLKDLICARVVKNCLGMNASLVGKGAVPASEGSIMSINLHHLRPT